MRSGDECAEKCGLRCSAMTRLCARLLHQRGLVAQENALHFLDVRHFRNGPALGNIAVTFVFGEPFAEVSDFKMPVCNFPNLSLRQDWRPTVPSQFHNAASELPLFVR